MTRRAVLILTVLAITFAYFAPQQEAQAFVDPVTIAILTPVAIKAAQIIMPYVIKGMKAMGVEAVKNLPDFIGIFYLPLGLLQCTILAPWYFMAGLKNTWRGISSPFLLVWDIITLPVAPFKAVF